MSHDPQSEPVGVKHETNPVKLAIWIGIGTVSLIVGIMLIVQFAVGAYGGRSLENDPAMAPEALAQRIGPVAKLRLEGAPVQAQAPQAKVATVAAVPAKSGPPDAKKIYDTACMACHATGAAGAPKLGDKAAWVPRLKAGNDALYAAAIKGKGAMPAKGGNASLTDADVKAAVDYMVAGSK